MLPVLLKCKVFFPMPMTLLESESILWNNVFLLNLPLNGEKNTIILTDLNISLIMAKNAYFGRKSWNLAQTIL